MEETNCREESREEQAASRKAIYTLCGNEVGNHRVLYFSNGEHQVHCYYSKKKIVGRNRLSLHTLYETK